MYKLYKSKINVCSVLVKRIILLNLRHAIKDGALKASAKSIDPCQPARSAQADMGRNFLKSANFLHLKAQRSSVHHDSVVFCGIYPSQFHYEFNTVF